MKSVASAAPQTIDSRKFW